MTRNYNKHLNIESDVEKGCLLEDRKTENLYYLVDAGISRPPSRSVRRVRIGLFPSLVFIFEN